MFDILVATTFGLEAVAVRELERMGYAAKAVGTGRVHLRGDALAVARCNLWLRSADRVLIRVAEFPARDFDALFEGVKALAWEEWIGPDDAFPVDGRSVRSQLSSVPALQRATKRAMVDRLRARHGRMVLPETGAEVRAEIGLRHDVATLTLDTSGDGLHKRGYRPTVGAAALKETLAAGLVLLSAWTPRRALVDPFCGTGTIAIEAALIGLNRAPGLGRGFAAERWGRAGGADWRGAFAEARAEAARGEGWMAPGELAHAIHATDVDEAALALARQHARAAGVEHAVHFRRQDFADLAKGGEKVKYGCVVTNPPYGERIGDAAELEALYRSMPVVLRRLPTWSFHILTAWLDLERVFGQEASRRRKLYNSTIECTYFTFLGPKPLEMLKDRGGQEDGAGAEAEERGAEAEGPEVEATADEAGVAGDAAATNEHRADQAGRDEAAGSGAADAGAGAGVGAGKKDGVGRGAGGAGGNAGGGGGAAVFGGLRERDKKEAAEFGARLAKNAQHLRKYPARGITCYRVYERDCPDVPLIVDRYEEHVHVAEYEREHSRTGAQQADWWDLMRRTIAQRLDVPPERVHMKEKHRQRGLTQHERVSAAGRTIVAHEGGLKFEVNLTDYVDTGLFLDHRLTRDMARREAAGKRVLNLFCYTGAFTVYAADGGARATTSVDLSNTYLEWAERNLGLNGMLQGAGRQRHRLVRADVLEFLRGHAAGEAYDLAVIDPPTFSNSKRLDDVFEVQRDHVELLARTAALLSPGGVVYFSNNYRRFKLDEAGVNAALRGAGIAELTVREITRRTIPPEYRNERIHQCWRMVRADGAREKHAPEAGGA